MWSEERGGERGRSTATPASVGWTWEWHLKALLLAGTTPTFPVDGPGRGSGGGGRAGRTTDPHSGHLGPFCLRLCGTFMPCQIESTEHLILDDLIWILQMSKWCWARNIPPGWQTQKKKKRKEKKNQYLRVILFQQNIIHSNLIVMQSTSLHFVHKPETQYCIYEIILIYNLINSSERKEIRSLWHNLFLVKASVDYDFI